MLTEVFVSVLIMSGVGSALFFLLLILKPLTERVFGVRWQFYIWLSVLIVLIFPLRIKTEFRLPQVVSETINTVSAKSAGEISVFEDYSGVYMSQAVHTEGFNNFWIIAVAWIVVAAILLIKTVVSNIALKTALKKNSVCCGYLDRAEIRRSDNVATPILFGGLKTVLYIPQEVYGTDKMQYITAHEVVHIRRNDISIKWFAALIKCIHWFNPLVYYLIKQINYSCEISCDAFAARNMPEEQKNEYMQTILEISQNEINFKRSLSAGLSSDGRCLKRRLLAIRKSDKIRPAVHAVGIAMSMMITFCSVYTCGIIRGSAQDRQPVKYVLVAPKADLTGKEEQTDLSIVPEIEEKAAQNNKPTTKILDTELTKEPKTEVVKRPVVVGEFNSDGGDTRIIHGIKPDEDGCVRLDIRSNTQEVVDVFVNDGKSGKEVHSFSIPIPHNASYVIDGLDEEKIYDIVLKGTMRNNWKIESEYTIY